MITPKADHRSATTMSSTQRHLAELIPTANQIAVEETIHTTENHLVVDSPALETDIPTEREATNLGTETDAEETMVATMIVSIATAADIPLIRATDDPTATDGVVTATETETGTGTVTGTVIETTHAIVIETVTEIAADQSQIAIEIATEATGTAIEIETATTAETETEIETAAARRRASQSTTSTISLRWARNITRLSRPSSAVSARCTLTRNEAPTWLGNAHFTGWMSISCRD